MALTKRSTGQVAAAESQASGSKKKEKAAGAIKTGEKKAEEELPPPLRTSQVVLLIIALIALIVIFVVGALGLWSLSDQDTWQGTRIKAIWLQLAHFNRLLPSLLVNGPLVGLMFGVRRLGQHFAAMKNPSKWE